MLILFVKYHDAFCQAAAFLMDRESDLEVGSQARWPRDGRR